MSTLNSLEDYYNVSLILLEQYILTQEMLWSLIILIVTALASFLIVLLISKTQLHNIQLKLLHTRYSRFAPRIHELGFLFILMVLLFIIVPILPIWNIHSVLLAFVRNIVIAVLVLRMALLMIPGTPRLVFIIAFACFVTIAEEFGLVEATVKFLDHVRIRFGDVELTALKIINATLVMIVTYFILSIIKDQIKRRIKASETLNPAQKVITLKFTIIGFVIALVLIGLTALGISLTAIALFTGAIGFGIGIGLQKIFLNLLSGFIILFDRSIKPGDVITVGNTFGWVNSLHGRYVSVITRDGREHLIPNEKFISEAVENWTYSSAAVRIKVMIPVSDSSDLYKTAKILLDVAQEHPRILEKPAPRAIILDIGDSAVNFELGVWILDPTEGITNVRSDLLFLILEKFRQNGISLPSPHRNIVIKHDDGIPD
jgi:small-conductance mechanosensitive channel